jgi:squalene synthase HpnC
LPGAEEVMARAGSENFPVASRLLGRRAASALEAIYGFARMVDEVGDSVRGDRLALLDWIDAEIDNVYAGGAPVESVIARLAPVVREHGIPPEPLHRLVEANRMDQSVHSYERFEDLLDYCALSANPVGHMVLYVFASATPDRMRLSDSICSGLQVTEHLQDVREDLEHGRVYLPQQDLARFGCTEEDLRTMPSPEPVRTLIAFEAERARGLFTRGDPLIRRLGGRGRFAIMAFVAGGRAALNGIERTGYGIEASPPRPSLWGRIAALAQTARALR